MTDLLDRTKEALALSGGWLTLKPMLETMGEDPEDTSVQRQVRSAISSTGDIISNSQQGYKLTRMATSEEIRHAVNDLRSRADDLERRARMIEDSARNRPALTMPSGTTRMPPVPLGAERAFNPPPEPDWSNINPSESNLWN